MHVCGLTVSDCACYTDVVDYDHNLHITAQVVVHMVFIHTENSRKSITVLSAKPFNLPHFPVPM